MFLLFSVITTCSFIFEHTIKITLILTVMVDRNGLLGTGTEWKGDDSEGSTVETVQKRP